MKIPFRLLSLFAAFILISCGNDKKSAEPVQITIETSAEEKVYDSEKNETEFKDPMVAKVFRQYINLKTALINTDSEIAALAGADLMLVYSKMDVNDEMMLALKTLSESKEIEVQRASFVIITAGVEDLLTGALSSGTIYKTYCPMAFNNTGAFWLSSTKEIRNPYFGDKMLKCGRIDSEIQ
jgi:hypothetical protein